MNRNTLNYWINLISFITLLALILTGLLIHVTLPPGTGGRHGGGGLSLWGYGRHDIGDVHFVAACVFIALMVIHLVLHWSWVCNTTTCLLTGKPMPPAARNIIGLLFLVLLLLLILAFLVWSNKQVRTTDNPLETSTESAHSAGHIEQMGQKTLTEISRLSGIPVETFIKQLKLPADIDPDEQLGRLRRRHGFDMDQIRKIIEQKAPVDANSAIH